MRRVQPAVRQCAPVMGISWSPEKSLPLAEVVHLLEQEMKAWRQTAEDLISCKGHIVDPAALHRAETQIYNCRARAEALRKLVARLCDAEPAE